MKPKTIIIRIIGAFLGLGIVVVGLPNLYIYLDTNSQVVHSVAATPSEPVAIILGAYVSPSGNLSPMLAERVSAGVSLYKTHHVQKLLLSGDNSSTHYDEVTAMQRYAVAHGVPKSATVLDYAGFDTYASCYRARAIFGLSRAIIVSQNYHVPRAVYLCNHLGVTVTGLGLPDWSLHPDVMPDYTAREALARVKAVWDITILHPKPKFLGQPQPIH